MPGIVGIIQKSSTKDNVPALSLMVQEMIHERTSTSGTYVAEQLGLYIGWVNNAGSFSDCMPVWNETRDICLIFYGENYADKEVTDRLRSGGHDINPSNAGYLVHLYEEQEEEFFLQLNGWFSGVVIDLRKGEVILFNDRYGMQRIYYHENKDSLFFSSSAGSLLKVCPELRNLDMKSLGERLSFKCVFENRTLFSNVFLLPPGSAWTFNKNRGLHKQCYFTSGMWENQASLGKEAFYTRFRETFANVLPRYFATTGKIALSLTGGLDTRMILAGIDVPQGELPCYTFGGMYHDCYDVKIARKIAKVCRQKHQVLTVDKRFFSEFPDLAEKTVAITDGNLDVSAAADLYVNRMAKEIAPVRLTGNYGSEILRGSRHLKARPACQGLYEKSFEKTINDSSRTLDEHHRDHRVSFAAFKQVPWYHNNRLVLEQSQLTVRSPYLDNDLVGLMYLAPAEVLNSNELSFRLIHDGNPDLGNIMTDRGLGGNNGYLLSKLAYIYREFLFKADYGFNYGMPQWFVPLDHHLLAPLHAERIFLGRHKFYHFRVWFRDQLADYVKEILLDPRSLKRPYLNGQSVEKIVLAHTSGHQNYTDEIDRLLTLELLQRSIIDQT